MVVRVERWESTQILPHQLNINRIKPYIHLIENIRINLISDIIMWPIHPSTSFQKILLLP